LRKCGLGHMQRLCRAREIAVFGYRNEVFKGTQIRGATIRFSYHCHFNPVLDR
jgi:hypothetical protein